MGAVSPLPKGNPPVTPSRSRPADGEGADELLLAVEVDFNAPLAGVDAVDVVVEEDIAHGAGEAVRQKVPILAGVHVHLVVEVPDPLHLVPGLHPIVIPD